MNFGKGTGGTLAILFALLCCFSCVEKDPELGKDYITTSQMYDLYTAEIPITEIDMRLPDSLSGYSDSRITIGAIRDEDYGLSTRSCALTLVPLLDTLDFGTNPKFRSFHFAIAGDTVSVADPNQAGILQNINVYALTERAGYPDYDINAETIKYDPVRITKGVPVYNGSDSLSFDFTEEFGKRYLEITQADLEDSLSNYLKKFPGIYLTCEAPAGNGGRFNFFTLGVGYTTDGSTYFYMTGNYAQLSFTSTYDGEVKDTSFLFYYSPPEFQDLDSLVSEEATIPQYAFNVTSQETRAKAGRATDKVLIEGGGGLKPVIPASELKRLAEAEISKHGDPTEAVVTSAIIELPFEFPEDYTDMDRLWPQYLTPTCRLSSDGVVAFSLITDSNNSSYEDIGSVDRSHMSYSPDITFHLQSLLRLDEEDTDMSNYDLWMLIMYNEVTSSNSSYTSSYSSDLSNYYYYMMMNSMYGGYGSSYYSGYSSYGSSYSYLLMAMYASQLASSSSSTTSTSTKIDKDRFYKAALTGPEADTDKVPTLKLTYAIPKE